jgi:hypothetical protein
MEFKLSYWQIHCVNLKINIRSEINRHVYFKYGKIFRVLKINYLICFKNRGFNQEIRYQIFVLIQFIQHSSANTNSICGKSYGGFLEWFSML